MLARHAESLFWAGRQIERAEDTARMLDVTYHGLLEAMPWEAERSWKDLLKVLWLDRPFAELEQGMRAATVSEFLVFDPDNPGAIVSAVGGARENARAARELISSELWEAINSFYLELRSRNLRADVEARPHELYDFVKRSCQTISGVAVETMPRDDGWRFLQLGWMLERAEMTCRLLDVRYSQLVTAGATGGFHHWLQTLKSASGSEAFRRRYRASMDPADVVEFLLLSRTFPRSVLFCLRAVEGHRAKVRTLCFARQGRYAVSSSYDRYVKIWTIPELTIKGAFAADSAIAATAVSENGDVIVAGDGQGCAHFLRFDGG